MPYQITDLKILFWDFDGVILDSMEVRDIGFRNIFGDYPEDQVEELLRFHRINGGLSRYVKIEHFFKSIVHETYDQKRVQAFADRFSEIMREELPQKKYLIQDALRFVKKYHKTMIFHIVSGSDQEELRYLCKELEIAQYFKSIHGSPTPKNQLVADLLSEHHYDRAKTGLIGDSINDFEAASVNHIQFFGYNSEVLEKKGNYVHSLTALMT